MILNNSLLVISIRLIFLANIFVKSKFAVRKLLINSSCKEIIMKINCEDSRMIRMF